MTELTQFFRSFKKEIVVRPKK